MIRSIIMRFHRTSREVLLREQRRASAMHNPDYSPAAGFLQINFAQGYVPLTEQPKITSLIQNKIDNKEYFYGIEISARSNNPLDYWKFSAMPLFTSLVWFSLYANVTPITDVDSLKLGQTLLPATVVVPHLTCYRSDNERLKNFLSLDFTNVLALRGDDIDDKQQYLYASDFVADIRKMRGDTISIGVGGYPDKHPDAKSMEEDIQYLKKKVDAGADFIITQICFDPNVIVKFVENCRKNGINVPILVAVYVPESMRDLNLMLRVTKVEPPENMMEYKKRAHNQTEFIRYSVESLENLIKTVFASDIGVYGIQLCTMNRFNAVEDLVNSVFGKLNKKK